VGGAPSGKHRSSDSRQSDNSGLCFLVAPAHSSSDFLAVRPNGTSQVGLVRRGSVRHIRSVRTTTAFPTDLSPRTALFDSSFVAVSSQYRLRPQANCFKEQEGWPTILQKRWADPCHSPPLYRPLACGQQQSGDPRPCHRRIQPVFSQWPVR
jgi:hypothetical protein